MRMIILAALSLGALAAPAQAQSYPVQGRWGQSTGSEKGPIDCVGKRVIAFVGNQRTDSNGGVPSYRNQSVTAEGQSNYRIVDEFTTGQISAGRTSYVLRMVDADHIEMVMEGGALKLQRCK
jgi:hypothetical protein